MFTIKFKLLTVLKKRSEILYTCNVVNNESQILKCHIYQNEKFANKMSLNGFYMARYCNIKTKDEETFLMVNSKSEVDIIFIMYTIIINFIK